MIRSATRNKDPATGLSKPLRSPFLYLGRSSRRAWNDVSSKKCTEEVNVVLSLVPVVVVVVVVLAVVVGVAIKSAVAVAVTSSLPSTSQSFAE